MYFSKEKTVVELRNSDYSSDVCSSDLKLPIIATDAKNGDVHLPSSPGRSARVIRMIPNRQLCRSGASITTLCHNPSAGSPSGANLAGGSGRTSQCRDSSATSKI